MHLMKYWLCFIIKLFHLATAQQYNLTGSSKFASLGKAFTWRCEMFLPPNDTAFFVKFYRNNILCVLIGSTSSGCATQSALPRYTYNCLSDRAYSLTIPAESMTENEQGSIWKCEHHNKPLYKSPDIELQIAIDVHNVSLTPSDNPLTLREGTSREVKCVVNSNAIPVPNITWHLGSTDITNIAGTDTTAAINITGNRSDNTKMLNCTATNNKNPPKTASTTLIIEYPPMVKVLSQKDIIEGRTLSVTCQATPGNPSSTTFNWTKVENSEFRENGTTLQLPNIQRTSSGTYRCTAENNYNNGEKGTDSQSMFVNVQYPPVVNVLSNQSIIEGRNLSVTCRAISGNPNSTTFYWTKVDNPGFSQNGTTLQLPNIFRTSFGTYQCTAENNYSNGERGRHSQNMTVDVQYPPIVNELSQQNIIEGRYFSITCTATSGNPSSSTFYWTKENNSGFRQNSSTLQIPNIPRTSSGSYRCTAENSYSNGDKGTHSQFMVINVLYQPAIENEPRTIVNESDKVFLSRNISGNPLSNASWYDGTKLLEYQTSRKITNYTIERASCENTKNFSLLASNGIGDPAKALVELIVNCKPKPHGKNITIGVNDTTGIEFSLIVVAYPVPLYELKYENGTKNNQMTGSIFRNAINNFTIHFNQTVVNQDDFGTYRLVVQNDFGAETIFVNILPQQSPESARNIQVKCEETSAKVQWISSFNGGERQTFTVFVLSGLDKIIISDDIPDKGENQVHDNYVQNLQPSSKYTFYVSAQNRLGNSSSEIITCTTTNKDAGVSVPLIAGGAAAGGITLATIVIVIIIFLRRCTQNDKQAGKIQRLKQEDESENINDDGLKDNVLYISAGPKVEKSEAAVYAEVNKKGPESNNNANVYAEVKKGFSKNDVSNKIDAKPKQKKGKKKKGKKDVADVYENSEDIAMASNMDSVYSNTAHKDQNKDERGYKNKDGLLYVEVKFDATSNKGNPVIHGENEKTDYATVEFPMQTTSHEETVDDKI